MTRSEQLFSRARALLPGGVNSPVRSFASVGGRPFFTHRAEGPYLWDVDGRRYIDFVGSYGPLILGHGHPEVIAALQRQLADGVSFGTPTELEVELAGLVVEALPSVDRVRFVNSGTEATMSALRLARAFTGRQRLVKFEGCYHGHGDAFLAAAGSGLATLGIAASPGVPQELAALTTTLPFNDLDAVEAAFCAFPEQIAAVIVEPVPANMGVVPPREGFLEGLREITRREGALLIFDEVITGFRLAMGGAQARFGVTPDLTTLGKIIGGGLPVGAYGGRADIMALVAPEGPVYQAGTLSGNPLAMAAGLAALRALAAPGVYRDLDQRAAQFTNALGEMIHRHGWPLTLQSAGSMGTLFFRPPPVRAWSDVEAADTERHASFFHDMLKRGVFLAPSPFEAMFLSTAHDESVLAEALAAFEASLTALFGG